MTTQCRSPTPFFSPAKGLERARDGHFHLLLHHQLAQAGQAPEPRGGQRRHVHGDGPLRGLRAERRVLQLLGREFLEQVRDLHGEAQGQELVLREGLQEAEALERGWVMGRVCVIVQGGEMSGSEPIVTVSLDQFMIGHSVVLTRSP